MTKDSVSVSERDNFLLELGDLNLTHSKHDLLPVGRRDECANKAP
jgi:hypothetical protein